MGAKRFSDVELYRLRNELPVRKVIETMLQLPSKEVEGVFRFLCPRCNEFQTAIHPRENLARCFRCQRNFNPIELVMAASELDFVSSVKFLQREIVRLADAKQKAPQVNHFEQIESLVARLARKVGGSAKMVEKESPDWA